MPTVEHFFPLDHAAAQGHFAGNPIIPGALLLSETLRAIETKLVIKLSPGRLASAKFMHPARPGDRIRIEFTDSANGAIKFTCTIGSITVLSGAVTGEALLTPA